MIALLCAEMNNQDGHCGNHPGEDNQGREHDQRGAMQVKQGLGAISYQRGN